MRSNRSLLLFLTALLITVGSLLLASHAVTPKESAWEDVVAEAKKGGYRLIKAEELWKRYQEEPETILLVDTRQAWEYRSGHIEGAFFFSMEPTWWSRWRKQGALEQFLGPDKTKTIVFY